MGREMEEEHKSEKRKMQVRKESKGDKRINKK